MTGENAGGMVASVTEGLKGSPACLAAVLLAALMLGSSYFQTSAQAERVHEREESNRRLMITILEKCPLDGRVTGSLEKRDRVANELLMQSLATTP